MVLKAINLGLMCMDKNNTQEQLQNAIMDTDITKQMEMVLCRTEDDK